MNKPTAIIAKRTEDMFIKFSRGYMSEADFNFMNLNRSYFVNLD